MAGSVQGSGMPGHPGLSPGEAELSREVTCRTASVGLVGCSDFNLGVQRASWPCRGQEAKGDV